MEPQVGPVAGGTKVSIQVRNIARVVDSLSSLLLLSSSLIPSMSIGYEYSPAVPIAIPKHGTLFMPVALKSCVG